MSKIGWKEVLVTAICALMAVPQGSFAAANDAAKRSALGSIETHGSVRVGGIQAPSAATLFDGDRVQTSSGGATVQYRQGARVVLASESAAAFTPARVQLEKGLMSFQTVSSSGIVFAASSLRLEPAAAKTSGNITFNDNKASIAVTEGTLKVVDPTGVQLASLNAGEARLFEQAEPAQTDSPSQDASAASSKGGSKGAQKVAGNSKRKWWIIGGGAAMAGAAVGAGLGLDSSNSTSSQITALMQQLNAALAQAQALQQQANTSQNPNAAAVAADLAAQIARLQALRQKLNSGDTSGVAADLANIQSSLNGDGSTLNGGGANSGTRP